MNQRFQGTAFFSVLLLATTMVVAGPPQVIDLNGNPKNPLQSDGAKAVVLIFLATDCPISNRYAPVVNRIYESYKDKGIKFYAIYPIDSDSPKTIESHRKDYGYTMPALMDKDHILVDSAQANVTPEAAVFIPGKAGPGSWVYCGRIDDLYVDFWKWRRAPSSNDLTNILDKVLAGETIEPTRTRAVGCYINN